MLTLALLAGGNSRRMGQDKALMPFLGRPLIQRVLDMLSPLADEVILSTNHPEKFSFLNIPAFADLRSDHGSLGGLYTCLSIAKSNLVAAVACDLPFASRGLFAFEISLLSKGDVDVVIPHSKNGLEPLHAVYCRESCLPIIENALNEGRYKMTGWFDEAKILEISSQEIAKYDPDGLAFLNLNTPQEFTKAEQMARRLDEQEK